MNTAKFSKIVISVCLAAVMSAPSAYCGSGSMLTLNHVSAAVSQSGKCGENVTFDIKDGVLTISGTGPMYTDLSEALWDKSIVTSVVVENGVTLIGDNAFSHMESLITVSISDTVKTIGSNAFSFCTVLKTVDFGKGVEDINAEAFAECSSLGAVVLKDKVKTIGDKVFYHCFSLKEVTLPESITSIGKKAFLYCGVGKENVNTKNVYNFSSYTVKDSYAASYIASLDKLAQIESEAPSEQISPYEYFSMVCVSLGDGMYYKLVDHDKYKDDDEVMVCYMPDIQSNPGDIFGIMFGQADKEDNYCASPVIKKHSDYTSEKIFSMDETVKYDKPGFLFGTVDAVYSDTCMTVNAESKKMFIICDSTEKMQPGKNITFELSEGVSGQNMNIYKSKKVVETCSASGISLGYNKQIDSTLFLRSSDKENESSLKNGDYFYIHGVNIPAGKNGVGVLFEDYIKSVADIPVLSLYKTSFSADSCVVPVDESKKSELKTGMLSARFTNDGGLVYLNQTDKIFLLGGIPEDAKPGDVLVFRTLNSVEKDVYYATDVKLREDMVYEKGDVNYDGKVNVCDLITLKSSLVEADQKNVDASYDIDGDTYFSVKDVIQLVNILLGSK